jgi:hypothetical protein
LAAVVIHEKLWKDIVALARQRRQRAEALAEQVLRDYVQRVSDEELLARSARAARGAKFGMEETEEVVKKFRSGRKRS